MQPIIEYDIYRSENYVALLQMLITEFTLRSIAWTFVLNVARVANNGGEQWIPLTSFGPFGNEITF